MIGKLKSTSNLLQPLKSRIGLRPKKSCFQKLAGWKNFYHSPARIFKCVSKCSSWWERDELINHSKYYNWVKSKTTTGVITKPVLKNFAIFTGKYLCWSLFLIKNFKPTLLKRDSSKVNILVNIPEFLRSTVLKNICERLPLSDVISTLSIWLLLNPFFQYSCFRMKMQK